MLYLRYHCASGATDIRVRVISEEHLAPHSADGYAFIAVANEPLEGCWVDHDSQEVFDPQVVAGPVAVLSAGLGEAVTLRDLPDDVWVREGVSDPQRVSSWGEVTFNSDEARTTVVQVVGRYTGPRWQITWAELDTIKAKAKARIDKEAETARAKIITPGNGQAMTYIRKADAARQLLAGLPISDAQTQRIQDEATRLGCDLDEAATVIVNQADRWEGLDAQIDDMRLSAKAAIGAASSGAAIQVVLNGLSWPA